MKAFGLLLLFVFLSAHLQEDWANLNRFKYENLKLMNDIPSDDLVVFMGNSITQGWLNKELTFFDNPNYINRGIGGQTTSQMLLRFRQDVIDLQPKAVVILAGINDIAQNQGPITVNDIFGNIKTMCELATSNKIKVILCSVLPAKEIPWRKHINPIEKVKQLNGALKDYAFENKILYVDFYNKLVTKDFGLQSNLTTDEVHLTVEGYKALEPLLMIGINNTIKN